jgi:hypothetical protein
MGQAGDWVFIAFFVLPKGGDVPQVSWEEVFAWPIIIFWDLLKSILQFPHSMIALTAVRDRDDEVYSVTASC